MNLQRLKFAWARGARIEHWNPTLPYRDIEAKHLNPPWERCSHTNIVAFNTWMEYRIHPDDEHLLYGPLSQACLDLAVDIDPFGLTEEGAMHWAAKEYGVVLAAGWDQNVYHPARFTSEERGMWFLFVAELLADEGL